MPTSRDKSSSRAFELRLHLNEEIDMKKFSGIRDRSLTNEREPEIIDRFRQGFPELSFHCDEKSKVGEPGPQATKGSMCRRAAGGPSDGPGGGPSPSELVRNTIEEMTAKYGSRFTNLQMRLNAFKTTQTTEV